MRRNRIVAATATLALAAGTAVLMPASQAAAPQPKTLAKGLVAPLSAAVAEDGTAYVTQNFAGLLTKVKKGKKAKTIYASKNGNEVGGVSVRGKHVVFTETASDEQGNPSKSWVKYLNKHGKARTLANVRAYEDRTNPDGKITYGFRSIPEECAAQWPTQALGPASYQGAKDSHPYATYQQGHTVYVADAGMNAVLSISKSGKIRTVAVTPAVPVKITQEIVDGLNQQSPPDAQVPDCVVGLTYYGESVPTDVEMHQGKLYVTTEGGGLGEQMPLGAIYRIKPQTGKTSQVVGGLFGPVGLGLNPKGDIFVSQLFGGEISKIKHGTTDVRTFTKVGLPAAVEWDRRGLYATINVLPQDETSPPAGELVLYRR